MNKFLVLVIGLAFVVGCTPDREVVDIIKGDPGAPGIPGAPGADGKDGVSCSVSEAEGGLLISCGEDNSILLPYAQPGQTCSVERIDDDEEEESGALITCGDDDPVFIADGTDGTNGSNGSNGSNGINGSSCSAEDIGDQIQISCEGSEPVYVADGEDGISCKVEPTSTGANVVCGVEGEPGYSTTSITNGTNGTTTYIQDSTSECLNVTGNYYTKDNKLYTPGTKKVNGVNVPSNCGNEDNSLNESGDSKWLSSSVLGVHDGSLLKFIHFNNSSSN